MMNTGKMQGVMAARGTAPGSQQTQNSTQAAIMKEIVRSLSSQPTIPGWRAAMGLPPRAGNIRQLISSLVLLKQMSAEKVLPLALALEQETFQNSADVAAYDKNNREKLYEIHAEREKQAANMESQFQNPQNGQMNMAMQQVQMQHGTPSTGQAQFQQGFPNPQLQRAMQPTPMATPQQVMHNYNQQQPMNHNVNTPQMQMQMQQGQPGQTSLQNIPRNNSGQLTTQETAHVIALAQQMRARASPQEIETVKQKLNTMSEDQKRMCKQTGVDPLLWYYRNVANRLFIQNRARYNSAQHQNQSIMMPGTGAPPQQPLSMPQNGGSSTAPQFAGVTQGFDPSFGNMQQIGSQIFGLQQDALRSQEEGQVVVPVSANQKALQQQPQGTMQLTPQQQNMGQSTAARSMMNPSQVMHQAARVQTQGQIQNAGGMQNQMQVQQNNLLGQAGGLNGHMNHALPQRSPAMPNLNRPLGPSAQMSQNQGPSQLRQPGPSPQVQAKDAGSADQTPQQQGQGRSSGGDAGHPGITPRQLHDFPPQMQPQVANLSPALQLQAWMNYQKQVREQAANPGSRTQPNGSGLAGQDFQVGQGQPLSSYPMNQSAPGQTPALGFHNFGNFDQRLGQPQNMPNTGQRTMQGRPFEPQFRPQQTQQVPQPRAFPSAPKLTDEQVRMMDQRPFPPGFLNAAVMQLSPPQGVKLWGELKVWAAQNQNSMPADMLGKLRHFQALHFADIAKKHAAHNQQRLSHIALTQRSSVSAPAQQLGPAPPAPMVATRGNLSQAPNSNPIAMTGPPKMHQVHQVSAEELQNVRMQHMQNPRIRNMPDDILRHHLMQRKAGLVQEAVVAQQQIMSPEQVHYQNMHRVHRAQQEQFHRQNFLIDGQNGQTQPQQAAPQGPQATSNAITGTKNPSMGQGIIQEPPHLPLSRQSVRPPVQTQPSQKGTKRVNEDDVIEVPDPKLAQQQQQRKAQPPAKHASAQQKPNPSQNTREAALQQQQSSQYALELRNQAAQTMAPAQQQQIKAHLAALARTMPKTAQESVARQQRYKEIHLEFLKNPPPPRAEVPMDNQMRNQIISFLQQQRVPMTRAKPAIPRYFLLTKSEEQTKDLLHNDLSFWRQYRGGDRGTGDDFVDRFTISLHDLQEASKNVLHWARLMANFQRFKQTIASRTQQPLTTSRTENSSASATVATGTNQAVPEAQARQATAPQRMNGNRESRAPAAPTSDKPPFSFGALSPPSGDGVPLLYGGPNSLTPDKLTIPPAKKRKIQNQPSSSVSTPVQALGTPATTTSSKVARTPLPRVQRQNVAPAPTFKCSESSCELAVRGFATLDDLHKHTKEKHPVVETLIKDPLEWALEGVRMGLGLGLNMDTSSGTAAQNRDLDKNMEMEVEKSTLASLAMKKSASMQGLTPMRMEGGTPMSRLASQSGYQSNPGVPRTPQQTVTSVKTPASDGQQPTSKAGQGEPDKVGSTSKEPSTPPNSRWKDTSFSPSEVSSFFPSPLDLQGLSIASLTPASTLSSGKSTANSPKESDIGESDLLNIRIESNSWKPDSWKPTAFEEDGVFLEDVLDDLDDPLLDLSWEDAFEQIIQPDKRGWDELSELQQQNLTPFDCGRHRWENY